MLLKFLPSNKRNICKYINKGFCTEKKNKIVILILKNAFIKINGPSLLYTRITLELQNFLILSTTAKIKKATQPEKTGEFELLRGANCEIHQAQLILRNL